MIATWMLSAIVFSTLLGIAAMCAESALRNGRRQGRWPWLVALVAAFLWPALAPLVRRLFHESPQLLDVSVAMPSVQVVPDSLPGLPVGRIVDVVLLSLWAIASAVVIARLLHAVVLVNRIRSASEPGIVDDVPVLITREIGPAAIGLLKPRVLIPTSLLELDRPLRGLALRHELEHGRAYDQLALLGSAVVVALVPWNLPIWWIVRRYRLAIEIDCDARVLAGEPNARQYGQLLLLISRGARVPAFAPMLAASSSHLERRVAAMLPVAAKGRHLRIVAALVAAVVVFVAACSSRISDVITGPGPEVAAHAMRPASSGQPTDEIRAVQIPGTGKLHYPEALRAAYVEGEVLAQFVVDPDGTVEPGTFKVLRSSHPLFTDAVRAALGEMRFSPATVRGKRVKQLVQQPFTFAIDPLEVLPPARFAGSPFMPAGKGVRAANNPAEQIRGTGMIRYPDELRKANVQGEVIAQFVVTEDGKYLDGSFKVVKSSNPLFDEAVRKALPTMQFSPAHVNGTAVRQMLQQPFTFSLSKQ